ncbi:MAG: family finger-like protein [Myxococcales bacterium]|nr:family finger-like protein [Myxococcales bacterium]
MKIVCDACQAKYSISDDKVQGKVFKIRCKKCSNIIVVRGGAGGAEAAPAPQQEKETRVYDYGYEGGGAPAGDDAVWHLVINQDQIGPLTVAEVNQKFAAGEVDGETFTWREGFADWLPLAQVDAFTGLVASGSTTTAHSGGGGGHAAVSAMFGGGGEEGGTQRSDPGDLFAAASSSSRGEDDDGGDLFGSKPSSHAKEAANQKLRGERNENSVLFSLNNLAQLASDKPSMSAPSSSSHHGGSASAAPGHATGQAGGEGSGLIDIRSMANAYLGTPGQAPRSASAGIGSIDDLPVFGGGGFSEPAVLVPSASRSSNNKLLYGMIGAVGLLLVAAMVMIFMLMKGGKEDKKSSAVAMNETTGSAAGDKPTGDKPAGDKPIGDKPAGDKPVEGSAAAAATPPSGGSATTGTTPPTPPADKPPAEKPPADKPPAEKAPAHSGTTTTPRHTSSTPTPAPTPKDKTVAEPKQPKADAGGGGCDEVSCVLANYEGACCSKFKKGGGHAASNSDSGSSKPKSDLPDALDRSMISAGVGNVKGRVTSCGDKSSAKGKVKVHVKVGSDGRVQNVNVEVTPDPALGACVAAAMQKASFAKTQTGGSFSYPFVF